MSGCELDLKHFTAGRYNGPRKDPTKHGRLCHSRFIVHGQGSKLSPTPASKHITDVSGFQHTWGCSTLAAEGGAPGLGPGE